MAEDAEVGGLEADNQLQDLNPVQVREAARKKVLKTRIASDAELARYPAN